MFRNAFVEAHYKKKHTATSGKFVIESERGYWNKDIAMWFPRLSDATIYPPGTRMFDPGVEFNVNAWWQPLEDADLDKGTEPSSDDYREEEHLGSSVFDPEDEPPHEEDATEREAPLVRRHITFDQWQSGSPQQRFPNSSYNEGANGVRTTKSTWGSGPSTSRILSRRGSVILSMKKAGKDRRP